MAYTYHDWQQQTTAAARLSRLRLHLAEVSQLIAASVSSNGSSRSTDTLERYWEKLTEEEKSLVDQVGVDGAGAAVVGVFRLGRVSE